MRDRIIVALLWFAALGGAAMPVRAGGRDASANQPPPEVAGTGGAVAKYIKSTPEQDAAEIAKAQATATAVCHELKCKPFVELQTAHFIIFTNWDPKEYTFLNQNVEGAYTAVAKQFEMSPKDNVFIGKLPIYMLATWQEFSQFSRKIDNMAAATDALKGYYAGRTDGSGHMVMWKPVTNGSAAEVTAAEHLWAYVLTHEFTHAFIARYRSNQFIPRWLNEGMAEVVAQGQFPRANVTRFARLMLKNDEVDSIFDDKQMPPGEMYPVMETMVQALIAQSPKTFLNYFNDLKDGVDPIAALQKYYHVDNAGLEAAWKQYIKTVK